MALDVWLMYLLAVVVVCVTPGPNMLLAMTHSVQHGVKRTSVTALGCITATSAMAVISATGLGALLIASETAFLVIKWIGGAYLIYMGLSLWLKRDGMTLVGNVDAARSNSLYKLYTKGLMVSASNPKVMIFFGALFPLFIDPQQPLLPQFSIMLVTFLFISFGFIMGFAMVTSRLAPYLQRKDVSKTFNRVTGGLFMGIGVALATSEK